MNAPVIWMSCTEHPTNFRKLSGVQMQNSQLCWSNLQIHVELLTSTDDFFILGKKDWFFQSFESISILFEIIPTDNSNFNYTVTWIGRDLRSSSPTLLMQAMSVRAACSALCPVKLLQECFLSTFFFKGVEVSLLETISTCPAVQSMTLNLPTQSGISLSFVVICLICLPVEIAC